MQVEDGRPVLKNVTMFAERLRFLLTLNDGRLPLDSLQGLYISAFGGPPLDTHGKDWLNTKLIHYAPHVVNITGHKWVVWAPAGRPYPTRKKSEKSGDKVSASSSSLSPGSPQVVSTEATEGWVVADHRDTEELRSVSGKAAVSVRDLAQIEEAETMPPQPSKDSSESAEILAMEEGGGTKTPKLSTQPSPLLPLSNSQTVSPPQPTGNKSSPDPSAVSPSPPAIPSKTPDKDRGVPYDESPYGFLERDTELLAQMDVKEADSVPSTADALQRLIAAGRTDHDDFGIPRLSPPIPPPLPTNQSRSSKSPLVDDGDTDYLKAGLHPEEVLQELYRVKDSGGGVINPASMEPFLSYFGELSSRELERLESQETTNKATLTTAPAAVKTTSPTPTKLRNKRMMAIRFPGQGPDPNDIDLDLQRTLESLKLPDVPNSSDEEEEEEDTTLPLRPVTRAELLAKLVGEDFAASFSSLSSQENKESSIGGGGGTSTLSHTDTSSLEPGAETVSSLPSFPRYYEQSQSGKQ